MANPKTATNRRAKEFRDAQRKAEKEKAEERKRALMEAYLDSQSGSTGGLASRQSAVQVQAVQVQIERAKQMMLNQMNQMVCTPSTPPSYWYQAMPRSLSSLVWDDVVERAPAVDPVKPESLKTAEPYKVVKRQPDYMEVITAWRAWKVEGTRLNALGSTGVWEPLKAIEATCNNSFSSGGHPAPQMDCQCGIWAFKDLDRLVGALSTYSGIRILGKVSLWGRVMETENGFRAQYAYPAELWLLDDSLEELGLIYDVPVRKVS